VQPGIDLLFASVAHEQKKQASTPLFESIGAIGVPMCSGNHQGFEHGCHVQKEESIKQFP
jgi:hypothetical protein